MLLAGHCVYYEPTGRVVDPNSIKVAVGKYRKDWYTFDTYQQKRDVSISLSRVLD
jgi:hypothetical protein